MSLADVSDKCIAQGCGTYSKHRRSFIEGVTPTHVSHGAPGGIIAGDQFYFDTVSGLGANLYGYQNTYSLPTEDEVNLAKIIVDKVECIDCLKFLKTGSEACLAAVRIARAWQERERFPKGMVTGVGSGYHGWGNMFIAEEFPGSGTWKEGYTKVDSLDDIIMWIHAHPTTTGYVIIEPVSLDYDVKWKLEEIRTLCDKHGITLIFDEVITGGRFLDFCVSNHFGVKPDIICLGKSIANGYPLSIVGGKRELMEGDYFVSSTFSGESESIKRCIGIMEDVDENIKKLWAAGEKLIKEFNSLSPKIQLRGYPTRCVWEGDELFVAVFWQEMVKNGFLCGKPFFLNTEFISIIPEFIRISKKTIDRIESKNIQLEGQLPRFVFRR